MLSTRKADISNQMESTLGWRYEEVSHPDRAKIKQADGQRVHQLDLNVCRVLTKVGFSSGKKYKL